MITAGPRGFATSLDYGYDSNGNATSIVDGVHPGDSMTIAYDELDRQVKSAYPNAFPGMSYYRGYDATGNVLFEQIPDRSMGMSYDAVTNRLRAITAGPEIRLVNYDALGNVVSDGVRTLTFDIAGNLRSSQTPVQKTFAYDGRDRVISRTDAHGVRYFIYSGENLMMEYSPGENMYTEYVYLRRQLVGSRVVTMATQMDSNGNGAKDADEFRGTGW
jgi:YD repeat-containing protein